MLWWWWCWVGLGFVEERSIPEVLGYRADLIVGQVEVLNGLDSTAVFWRPLLSRCKVRRVFWRPLLSRGTLFEVGESHLLYFGRRVTLDRLGPGPEARLESGLALSAKHAHGGARVVGCGRAARALRGRRRSARRRGFALRPPSRHYRGQFGASRHYRGQLGAGRVERLGHLVGQRFSDLESSCGVEFVAHDVDGSPQPLELLGNLDALTSADVLGGFGALQRAQLLPRPDVHLAFGKDTSPLIQRMEDEEEDWHDCREEDDVASRLAEARREGERLRALIEAADEPIEEVEVCDAPSAAECVATRVV